MSIASDLRGQRQELANVYSEVAVKKTPVLSAAIKSKVRNSIFNWTEAPIYTPGANAASEGADYVLADPSILIERDNVTQIFSKTVVMTKTQLATDVVGRFATLAEQTRMRMEELKMDQELALLSTQVKSVVGGLRKSASLAAQMDAAVVKDLANAAITEDILLAHLAGLSKLGCAPTQMVVEPMTGLILQKALQAGGRTRELGAGMKAVWGATQYVTEFAVLDIVYSNQCPVGTIFLIDPAMVEVATLRPLEINEVHVPSDREAAALVVECGFKLKNARGCSLIKGIKTA